MQAAAAIVRCLAGPATTSAVGHAGEGRLLAASCDPDVRFAQSYRSAAPPSAPASLSRLSAGNPNYVRQALSDAPDDPLNRHRFIVVAVLEPATEAFAMGGAKAVGRLPHRFPLRPRCGVAGWPLQRRGVDSKQPLHTMAVAAGFRNGRRYLS